MSNKKKIEFVLDLVDKNFRTGFDRAMKSISAFNKEANNGIRVISALEGAVGGLVGVFVGMSAARNATDMMARAGDAAFNLEASLRAANREFSGIGNMQTWGDAIGRLSDKLRIYSETDIKNAVSRTIDMTKRLGLSAEQMETVIELTGDISAGKTDLEGGIERVTAALRGEAEASEYLGLTLNENYVKAWYNAHGAMQGAWKDLTDIQKAQVRYQVFLEQASSMQGRAAESANTFAGAIRLAKTEIEDAVTKNKDVTAAMNDLAVVIRDNSDEISNLVAKIITVAAKVVEWAVNNQDLVISFTKLTAKIYLFFKSLQLAGAAVNIVKGLNAAFFTFTGSTMLSALSSFRTALAAIETQTTALSVAFKGFLALAAADAVLKIGRLVYIMWDWKKASDELAQAKRDLAAQKSFVDAAAAPRLEEINKRLGTTFKTMDDLFQAEKDGKVAFDDLTGTWVRGSAEMTDATKKQASASVQVTGKALEEMRRKYQQYADEVKRLQDQISGREKSLAEQLRAMARTGMDDLSAWRDRKKEAEEYEEAARKAAEAGNFEEAVKLADQAKQAYADLNKEVKDGDQVLVSQQEALQTAMDGVKSAGELAIDILRQQQDAAADAMDALVEKSGFQDLEKGMDEAKKKWLDNWTRMRRDAIKDIDAVEDRLVRIKDKEVTVWINEKVKRATGGIVGFSRGGKLAGYGGGDRINALLEAGEYVIRKEAVAKFGTGLFHALNSLRMPSLPELPKFALGGPVAMPAAAGAAGTVINLTIPDMGTYPVQTDQMTADRLLRDIARKQRLRSR